MSNVATDLYDDRVEGTARCVRYAICDEELLPAGLTRSVRFATAREAATGR